MIVVVTGLPRSGTSLMMQMLDAGGIPLCHSNEDFPPDEHNPRGYYECADTHFRIQSEKDFLPSIDGHAVKIWADYLRITPKTERKNMIVILMMRPEYQRVRSLKLMFDRPPKWLTDHATPGTLERVNTSEHIINTSIQQRQAVREILPTFHATRPMFYPELIVEPKRETKLLTMFLEHHGFDFDWRKAIKVIDPELWRHR